MNIEKQITRTITTTHCEFMCLNVESAEVEIIEIDIVGSVKDKKTALKIYRNVAETETFKIVTCEKIEHMSELYSMNESTFKQYAKKIEKR